MTFINKDQYLNADEKTQALFTRHSSHYGYLPNYSKLYKNRTDVMDAWSTLQNTIKSHLSELDFELITVASAIALKSSYCALAHSQILLKKYFNEAQLTTIIENQGKGVLQQYQVKMLGLAKKVVNDATTVTQNDIDELTALGLTESAVFDVIAAASARCFFAKMGDALGALPDEIFTRLGKDVTSLLVLGREISTEIT